ncbi:hypothetical protein D3C72_812090 [compost metagenome]
MASSLKILISILLISTLTACAENTSPLTEDSDALITEQAEKSEEMKFQEEANYKSGICGSEVVADSNAVVEFCRPTAQRSFVEMEQNRIETLQCRLEVENFLAKYPDANCSFNESDGNTFEMSTNISLFTALVKQFQDHGF